MCHANQRMCRWSAFQYTKLIIAKFVLNRVQNPRTHKGFENFCERWRQWNWSQIRMYISWWVDFGYRHRICRFPGHRHTPLVNWCIARTMVKAPKVSLVTKKKMVPVAEYHLSACQKSIIGVWGSQNCVKTSLEVRTRRHFPRWSDINTTTHNEVIQNVKSMAYSTLKSTFSGSRNAMVTSKMPLNVVQDSHWQRAENSSSKPGIPGFSWMPVSPLANFNGSKHKNRFSGHTAVGNSAHWLHLSTFSPVENTLPRIPQGSSKPG